MSLSQILREPFIPGIAATAASFGSALAANSGFLSTPVQNFFGSAVAPLTGFAAAGVAAGVGVVAVGIFNGFDLLFKKQLPKMDEPTRMTLAFCATLILVGAAAAILSATGVIGGSILAATGAAVAIATVAILINQIVKAILKVIADRLTPPAKIEAPAEEQRADAKTAFADKTSLQVTEEELEVSEEELEESEEEQPVGEEKNYPQVAEAVNKDTAKTASQDTEKAQLKAFEEEFCRKSREAFCANPFLPVEVTAEAQPADPKVTAPKKTLPRLKRPPRIKETLNTLFAGSPYSMDALPIYPLLITRDYRRPERQKMTAPLMRGATDLGHYFFAIKVDCTLTDEIIQNYIPGALQEDYRQHRKQESVFVFYETPNFVWQQVAPNALAPFFFTSAFTDPVDGSGPVEDQKNNFKKVQQLLQTGSSEDVRGLVWTISNGLT